MCEHLGVSVETIRTYWKRIYRKANCRKRDTVRAWIEMILTQEIDGVMAL